MRVVEVRSEAEFRNLERAWNELVQKAGPLSIFVTWDWAMSWWEAYGEGGSLLILMAIDAGNVLRGIAPLRRRQERRFGQTVSLLSLIGDHSNDSDYLDFVIESGYEPQVTRAFYNHLKPELRDGTVLELNEMAGDSATMAALKPLAADEGLLWTESGVACSTVRLPGDWEAYLGSIGQKLRKQIRALLRKIESRPGVQWGFCATREAVERMLPALFDLHSRRWAKEGKPGVYAWDKKRDFYVRLSTRLLDRGTLRFSWLQWNGRVVACQYGFVFGGVYYHLQEGYEAASEHWSFGTALRALTVREFLKEGVREYDFLSGTGWHKQIWGAETKTSKRILLAERTARNVLFCRGPELREKARESIRPAIPEKLLAMRRRVLTGASPDTTVAASSRGALANAAAKVYYHIGLPGLTRGLQQRYQFSPGAGQRRFAVEKRQHALVRILCYHRVNDDNDPFHPAMPVAAFDRQMKFLARNYHVVSLTSALDRLRNDVPGAVLAITFDDGYEDNHCNAFPILSRYRLPATVFLATGSIDGQETLWFSRLAHAIKHTDREFVDIEFDIPRRFGLRTLEERLRSNGELFSLLRAAPDAERRVWVERLLADLGVNDSSRYPDRMLTWDQIRSMKKGGIDFGSHTVTHPFLSKLTPERALWEVSESKQRIESEIESPVLHFAYPNGREPDLAAWNKDILRSAGYDAAVSTIWGANFQGTDCMELRRGQPWEADDAMFAWKLAWYQMAGI